MADAAVFGERRREAAGERYGPERREALLYPRPVREQRRGHGFADLLQPFQLIGSEDEEAGTRPRSACAAATAMKRSSGQHLNRLPAPGARPI